MPSLCRCALDRNVTQFFNVYSDGHRMGDETDVHACTFVDISLTGGVRAINQPKKWPTVHRYGLGRTSQHAVKYLGRKRDLDDVQDQPLLRSYSKQWRSVRIEPTESRGEDNSVDGSRGAMIWSLADRVEALCEQM
jgi:hypothetical protein